MTELRPHIPLPRRIPTLLALLLPLAFGCTLVFSGVGPAHAALTIPVDQPSSSDVEAKRAQVLKLARQEVARKVRERNRDNVPRYRNGKGRIAPYSIGAAWCASFATWVWGRTGFDDFRRQPVPDHLWPSFSREKVAVNVEALRTWAKETKRHTLYATPGDFVAYEGRHIGIVMKVNRKRRAIWAIEGNMSDRVRWVDIPMEAVIDYFSPAPIDPNQKAPRSILRPDVG